MSPRSTRRLALPAIALTAVLGVSACGGESASSAPAVGSTAERQYDDADVEFLTGMVPHHEQAVEMADLVLDADPPAEVAAVARRIKGAQDPEIEQMEQMLDVLGIEESAHGGHGGHGGGHSGGGHGGMMSQADMAALDDATGTEAARLFLEGMVEHHRGAVEASDRQVAEGEYEPAVELARRIKAAQQAEIVEMQSLLDRL